MASQIPRLILDQLVCGQSSIWLLTIAYKRAKQLDPKIQLFSNKVAEEKCYYRFYLHSDQQACRLCVPGNSQPNYIYITVPECQHKKLIWCKGEGSNDFFIILTWNKCSTNWF